MGFLERVTKVIFDKLAAPPAEMEPEYLKKDLNEKELECGSGIDITKAETGLIVEDYRKVNIDEGAIPNEGDQHFRSEKSGRLLGVGSSLTWEEAHYKFYQYIESLNTIDDLIHIARVTRDVLIDMIDTEYKEPHKNQIGDSDGIKGLNGELSHYCLSQNISERVSFLKNSVRVNTREFQYDFGEEDIKESLRSVLLYMPKEYILQIETILGMDHIIYRGIEDKQQISKKISKSGHEFLGKLKSSPSLNTISDVAREVRSALPLGREIYLETLRDLDDLESDIEILKSKIKKGLISKPEYTNEVKALWQLLTEFITEHMIQFF